MKYVLLSKYNATISRNIVYIYKGPAILVKVKVS